jgi:FXSXX-COOH protein
MGDDDLDIESSLIDLSRVDLATLTTLNDSALAHSLRRILLAAENPDEAIAEFQQSI